MAKNMYKPTNKRNDSVERVADIIIEEEFSGSQKQNTFTNEASVGPPIGSIPSDITQTFSPHLLQQTMRVIPDAQKSILLRHSGQIGPEMGD